MLVATSSEGKMREIRDALAPLGLELLSLADIGWIAEIDETGSTFEANALIKATAVAEATAMAALADDSGLEVDVLDGQPGVNSSRFAGPEADDMDRNRILVERLVATAEPPPWAAQYRCVLAYVEPEREPVTFESVLRGAIVPEARGCGGFGYDPHFLLPERGVTVGEIPLASKQEISHRGQALRRFLLWHKARAAEAARSE